MGTHYIAVMTWYVQPFTVRLLNWLGHGIDRLGLGPRLIPAQIQQRARRRVGHSDVGSAVGVELFEQACQSFSTDANLSFFGRLIAREVLTDAMVTRLRWAALHAQNDPRLKTPLNRPIIIAGLPRSGTTLLHRLLADVDGLRPLQTWELADPLALDTTPPARRKRAARQRLAVLRRLSPELDAKHVLDAERPEEEVSLFDPSFWTPTFWRFGMVVGYLEAYLSTDPLPGYRMYVDLLRVLQAQQPNTRFILKMPNHTGYLDAIHALIPQATIIQTHRDPVSVVASYASLMRSVHGVAARKWDADLAGKYCLQLWKHHADRCMKVRQTMPEQAVMDVRFEELVADLHGVATHILETADHPVPDNLDDLVARHQVRTGPRHRYALSDYGLSKTTVEHAFLAYMKRFL